MKTIVTLKSFPGHKGRPGLQGGSLPKGAEAMPISKDGALDKAIQTGDLDIPKDVKKRKFQMQNDDPATIAYAEKVWNAEVAEMKAAGISDSAIEKIDRGLWQLMASTDRVKAKLPAAALLAFDGMSKEDIASTVRAEMMSRYNAKAIPVMQMYDLIKSGKDPLSDEGLALFWARDHYTGDPAKDTAELLADRSSWEREYYTADNLRNPEHLEGTKLYEFSNRRVFDQFVMASKEIGGGIDEVVSDATNPEVAKGYAIIRDTSQRLFTRNGEDAALYRGIYDLIPGSGSNSNRGRHVKWDVGYQPVKLLEELSDGTHTEEKWVKDPNSWSGESRVTVQIPKVDTVILDSDELVAWTPSKQIAKTFAAGGGMRGPDVYRKAMLSKTNVPSYNVAYYWPAIYHSLGSSIDTKEVWLQTNGEMQINIGEVERLKELK
jgi:hypothetical protein